MLAGGAAIAVEFSVTAAAAAMMPPLFCKSVARPCWIHARPDGFPLCGGRALQGETSEISRPDWAAVPPSVASDIDIDAGVTPGCSRSAVLESRRVKIALHHTDICIVLVPCHTCDFIARL